MTRGGLVQAKICDFSTLWLSRFPVDVVISVNRIFYRRARLGFACLEPWAPICSWLTIQALVRLKRLASQTHRRSSGETGGVKCSITK
jgi:hypothetical protein